MAQSSESPQALRYQDLAKSFGGKEVLKRISLSIAPGTMAGIIGRSGAGKSTLLRLTNCLIEPTRGRIFYGDLDVTRLGGRALRAWRVQAAMIFQQFNLVGRLDVLTNVLIGRVGRGASLAFLLRQFSVEDRARAIAALDHLGLADFALERADRLSGGQQQRVAIARAMVQEPTLLLADEPIASLDPRAAGAVMEDMKHLNAGGLTILCSIHALDTARAYCDRLIGLAGGEVVFDGPPAALNAAGVLAIYGEDAAEPVGAA
jgi:phosphonate transport system ATP-binding protein